MHCDSCGHCVISRFEIQTKGLTKSVTNGQSYRLAKWRVGLAANRKRNPGEGENVSCRHDAEPAVPSRRASVSATQFEWKPAQSTTIDGPA